MRKDVKLGLAVGGILFGAVMVYVLFFANAGKTGTDHARSSSAPTVPAVKQDGADSQTTDQGASSAAAHPLTSILPNDSTTVTPTTQPTDTSATVSIFGPASRPVTPAEPTVTPDSTVTSSVRSSGTFSWRDALENGGNSAARSTTPDASEHSSSITPTAVAPTNEATPSVEATATTQPSTGPRIYVVKPGDSLWSIAKAEYGSASYYPHLARANPRAASRLRVGMKIVLPAKDEVVPEGAKAVFASSKVIDPTHQYRVQAGDNLYTICKKLYGKTDRVTKLYELNKNLIGPNRSALKPNMVLQLPDPPTANSAATSSTSAASPSASAPTGTAN